MARLKIYLRGAQISDIALDQTKEYVAGRKESCDIKLQSEKGISREHFKLKFQDGAWSVQSLSRFGEIYTGGERVEKIMCEHGSSFQVPPYEFQFRDLPEEEFNDSALRSSAGVVNENDRTVVGVSPQVPFIKMMTTGGEVKEMLRLESGDVWVAGRDQSCQIVIADQRVSRKQYEIRKINGVFTIIDLNSVNGTFLNGSPISAVDPQTLKSGDSIGVLDNLMYFELHDPNFKIKVDNIEIPQLNLTDKELSISSSEFENISEESIAGVSADSQAASSTSVSQVSQAEVPKPPSPLMMQQVEEPYTQQQPNFKSYPKNPQRPQQQQKQYYQYQPNMGAGQRTPQPPKKKFTDNKVLMFTIVLAVLGGAFYVSDLIEQSNQPPPEQKVVSTDPFSRLSPEQRKTVQDMYSMSQKAMLQNKYSFAIENLKKLHEMLPTGYQDSKSMLEEATLNEQIISQKLEQDRLDKIKAEQDLEIQNTAEKCQKILNNTVTVEKMRECLSNMALIDPGHPEYTRLMSEAEKIVLDLETERRRKEEEAARKKKAIVVEVEKDLLEELFKKAEAARNLGLPYKAMKSYKAVINSEHKDLHNYKPRSEERIAFIQAKIQEKLDQVYIEAEPALKDGKLKEAISILRQGQDIDPNNEDLNDVIQKHVNDLKNQVKVLYQESIIDENFGNLDGDDTRQGAKQKWKKILDMDIEDGEYYRKAFVKLKRYGVF